MQGGADSGGRWVCLFLVDVLILLLACATLYSVPYALRGHVDDVWVGHRLHFEHGSAINSIGGQWKGEVSLHPGDLPLTVVELPDTDFAAEGRTTQAGRRVMFTPLLAMEVSGDIAGRPEGEPISGTVHLDVSYPTKAGNITYTVDTRRFEWPVALTPSQPASTGLHRLLLFSSSWFFLALVSLVVLLVAWRRAARRLYAKAKQHRIATGRSGVVGWVSLPLGLLLGALAYWAWYAEQTSASLSPTLLTLAAGLVAVLLAFLYWVAWAWPWLDDIGPVVPGNEASEPAPEAVREGAGPRNRSRGRRS